jgi:sec-independent protein translocase protein TatA
MTITTQTILAMFGLPGGPEWIVLGGVALLIFGKKLPEVGRSLGRGLVEFKKGLHGIDEANSPPLKTAELGLRRASTRPGDRADHRIDD